VAQKILLAVDLSYQVYRAAAAYPMLTSGDTFTGGLYGFLAIWAKTMRESRATHVVFCQDRKPYLRSLTYPDYKQLRKKNADDELLQRHKESMGLVLDLLHSLGLPVWGMQGYESDDLIAHVVRRYAAFFDYIYAHSNDSDLFQLLTVENFGIYHKDAKDVMTRKLLMETLEVTPDEYMLATALTGTHNDIEGIHRVGIKTALKALRDPSLMRIYREKHAAVIDRNLELIRLPHPDFPAEARLPSYRGGFDDRQLYRLLGRYDIDCTASMLAAFEQIQPPRRSR
jgi:DNA polymerase-1